MFRAAHFTWLEYRLFRNRNCKLAVTTDTITSALFLLQLPEHLILMEDTGYVHGVVKIESGYRLVFDRSSKHAVYIVYPNMVQKIRIEDHDYVVQERIKTVSSTREMDITKVYHNFSIVLTKVCGIESEVFTASFSSIVSQAIYHTKRPIFLFLTKNGDVM